MKTLRMLIRKYGVNGSLIILEMLVIVWLFVTLAHFAPFLWLAAFLVSLAAYLSLVNRDTNPENNLDYRSFVHHYEDGVWMYQCPVIAEIRKDFDRTLAQSEEIHPESLRMRFSQKVLRDCIRLFAPML